jgi:hypothetical protein
MFLTGGDEAALAAGDLLGATIDNFGSGDSVDFKGVKYASGDAASTSNGVVTIVNSTDVAVASFDVSGTYTSANFSVGKDASGDILVTYASAAAAASEAVIASPTDLLGSYATNFTEAPHIPASDSWALLAPSAGADLGTFSLNDENGGIFGGARGAVGIADGWKTSNGHGPGPSS